MRPDRAGSIGLKTYLYHGVVWRLSPLRRRLDALPTEAIAAGLAHHQAGRMPEAEQA